jgi:glyoxylase-like metal-dependent hydrolase (beta-lactamase superfamily II)
MSRRRKALVVIALGFLGLTVGTWWSFLPSPLPAPAPWTSPLPVASPPASMAIFQLPTGTYETPAGLAFRGGSFSDQREFAATAILVRHPKGDLLFDTGFGAAVEEHIAMLPKMQRSPHHTRQTAREQLAATNYDLSALKGVVITHSHWDHSSGAPDLPAPVWMNAAEQRYAGEDHDDTKVFRSFSNIEIQSYSFEGGPYLGFPSSYDVWGDGSVVLVPAPGHTPGSIVAFITLPAGRRYALIGDLTWQLDGIEKRAERPLMLRMLADVDASAVRQHLLHMIALAPHLTIVPAHDTRAYADIPLLH